MGITYMPGVDGVPLTVYTLPATQLNVSAVEAFVVYDDAALVLPDSKYPAAFDRDFIASMSPDDASGVCLLASKVCVPREIERAPGTDPSVLHTSQTAPPPSKSRVLTTGGTVGLALGAGVGCTLLLLLLLVVLGRAYRRHKTMRTLSLVQHSMRFNKKTTNVSLTGSKFVAEGTIDADLIDAAMV